MALNVCKAAEEHYGKSLVQVAKEYNINYKTLIYRLQHGLSYEAAVKPVDKKKSKRYAYLKHGRAEDERMRIKAQLVCANYNLCPRYRIEGACQHCKNNYYVKYGE